MTLRLGIALLLVRILVATATLPNIATNVATANVTHNSNNQLLEFPDPRFSLAGKGEYSMKLPDKDSYLCFLKALSQLARLDFHGTLSSKRWSQGAVNVTFVSLQPSPDIQVRFAIWMFSGIENLFRRRGEVWKEEFYRLYDGRTIMGLQFSLSATPVKEPVGQLTDDKPPSELAADEPDATKRPTPVVALSSVISAPSNETTKENVTPLSEATMYA